MVGCPSVGTSWGFPHDDPGTVGVGREVPEVTGSHTRSGQGRRRPTGLTAVDPPLVTCSCSPSAAHPRPSPTRPTGGSYRAQPTREGRALRPPLGPAGHMNHLQPFFTGDPPPPPVLPSFSRLSVSGCGLQHAYKRSIVYSVLFCCSAHASSGPWGSAAAPWPPPSAPGTGRCGRPVSPLPWGRRPSWPAPLGCCMSPGSPLVSSG